MAQFHHPNVVKLYGIISRVDPIMIIMEYLDNGSLDRYLQVHTIIMQWIKDMLGSAILSFINSSQLSDKFKMY